MRIEDTDQERSNEENTGAILESLRWLGLDWDEGPYLQSERKKIYLEHIEKLLDEGKAYYCKCTPEELAEKKRKALAERRKPMYDRTCRELGLGPGPGRVVRFKTPLTGETLVNDIIQGPVVFRNEELDDLVILRSDGWVTYNFAVVVDDATMKITHVIRGSDHLNNTPRQILIFKALGYELPRFAHVPLILGPDRKRLSKRHGATSVLAYRDMGYLPEALFNFLVRIGWAHGDQEIFSKEELIKIFSLEAVGKSAGVFNPDKLLWLNSYYIKKQPTSRLAELIVPHLEALKIKNVDREYLEKAIETMKTKYNTLREMAEKGAFYFKKEIDFVESDVRKYLVPEVLPAILELFSEMKKMNELDAQKLEDLFRRVAARYGLKLIMLAQPIRVALSGRSVSPGLFEMMSVLGKDETFRRIENAIAMIKERAAKEHHGS